MKNSEETHHQEVDNCIKLIADSDYKIILRMSCPCTNCGQCNCDTRFCILRCERGLCLCHASSR